MLFIDNLSTFQNHHKVYNFFILNIYEGYYLCTSYVFFFFLLLGKYYLVDVGYPLRKGYLTPYKGQMCHLPDFQRASRGNHLEKRFNYVHSSLKSAIQRTFEVWKNRWKFLKQMTSYNIKDQRNIIVATCVLRNFIRKQNSEDEGFEWDEHNLDNPGSNISEEDSSS